jgi:hypothetical protein
VSFTELYRQEKTHHFLEETRCVSLEELTTLNPRSLRSSDSHRLFTPLYYILADRKRCFRFSATVFKFFQSQGTNAGPVVFRSTFDRIEFLLRDPRSVYQHRQLSLLFGNVRRVTVFSSVDLLVLCCHSVIVITF